MSEGVGSGIWDFGCGMWDVGRELGAGIAGAWSCERGPTEGHEHRICEPVTIPT